ncbi:MAG: hypothetical protein JWP02_1198 [Acidimicrobiales bacterium]|nr:hypothetical protein [Acidimicrobiales bacterium]
MVRSKGYLSLAVWDAVQNHRWVQGDRRFLVVRDPAYQPLFYDVVLNWLALYFPETRALFELRTFPCRVWDWKRYALHVPWLQDPVQAWSPRTYELATRLAAQCDAHGVPVVNRVDRLTNAGKSAGARLIGSTGLRTPRMARIDNKDEFRETRLGIPLPLFVREDWGHWGRMVRADTDAEVRDLALEGFVRPVAVELIDVRTPHDGLFRKYRYVVAGEVGVPQTLHVSRDWCVRGAPAQSVFNDALRDEELAYTSCAEPNHARFVAARRALDLDFIAFDYSFDEHGSAIVWEANPYPTFHFSVGRREYRGAPTARALAAMTKLYLDRAGMHVPDALEGMLVQSEG